MKIALFLMLTSIPFILEAQRDPSIKPIAGPMGYQSRGAHWEGFYRSLVSAADLQIVNFTKGAFKYSASQPENLKLSVPVATNRPVSVRCNAIPRNVFYQMDVLLTSGKTFIWNTGGVLLKNQNTKYSRLLGILGFQELADKKRVYFPIQTNDQQADAAFEIVVVASTPIKEVEWQVQDHTSYQKIREGLPFQAGQPIRMQLPKSLKPGTYVIKIKGMDHTGTNPITDDLQIKI